MRVVAIAGLCSNAALWVGLLLGNRHDPPNAYVFLLVGLCGMAGSVAAFLGLRGSGLAMRLGLMLLGLAGLGSGGYFAFVAWVVAILPRC